MIKTIEHLVILPQKDRVKLAALHAIDRPIDDMSVEGICRTIGVSRQTFYSHFKSKYDIAYWFLYLSEDMFLQTIESQRDWRNKLILQIRFLYNERGHLCDAFASNPHDIDVIPRFEASKSRLFRCLSENDMIITMETRYCVDEYVNMHYRMLVSWCMHGMQVEPASFGQICYHCIPNYLVSLFDPSSSDQCTLC